MSWVDDGKASQEWRRSSYCTGADATCVEVAAGTTDVSVRDSKDAAGSVLRFTAQEWRAFLLGVRTGEFDV